MLTPRRIAFGGKRDMLDDRDRAYVPGAPSVRTGSVDLRQYCGPVYDQLPLHSCAAHALASALEFLANVGGETPAPPSRLFIYYNARLLDGSLPADDGATIRNTLKCAAARGVSNESLWPYDAANASVAPPVACYEQSAAIEMEYFRIRPDLGHLQACLREGYGFIFGIEAYEEGFAAAQHSGSVPMPAATDTLAGGHALFAVGFDDATQTYTAQNSLGPAFGDAGFLRLPYAYLENPKLAYDFWTLRKPAPA